MQTLPRIPNPAEAAWDHYLISSELGQFQQTSGWAQVKQSDGWSSSRLWLESDRPESGGAQLLWKRTRLGRIAYISKGPVLPREDSATLSAFMVRLHERMKELGLRALILQPPDESAIQVRDLAAFGFETAPLPSVIFTTAMVSLAGGRSEVQQRMHAKARQQSRLAAKRGVHVRRGTREDLPAFFALMEESARRQNSSPNPARVESLQVLWDVFAPRVLLGIAEVEGAVVSGLLMIGHGRRLTFWKKGWNSQGTTLYANCLLNAEALGWACDLGYACGDFVGMDPAIADRLLAGAPLDDEQLRSRDMFNLRLGAQPRRLPPAQLFICGRALRNVFGLSCRLRPLGRWLLERAGRS